LVCHDLLLGLHLVFAVQLFSNAKVKLETMEHRAKQLPKDEIGSIAM
jgi:hypothetical protein